MSRSTLVFLLVGSLSGLWIFSAKPATAQTGAPRVLTFMESIKGNEEVELRWPVALAAASAEEIAVADAFGPRLLRFRRIGVLWQLDHSLQQPLGLFP